MPPKAKRRNSGTTGGAFSSGTAGSAIRSTLAVPKRQIPQPMEDAGFLPADKAYYCKNITHESNIKSASKFTTKCNEDGWLNRKSYLELHVQGIHRPKRQLLEGRRLAGRGRPRKGRRNADMSTFSKRAAWAQARRTGRMASRGQQDTVMKTRNPEDNAPGKTGQWKDVDLDGVRDLLNVAQIKDMTNSGTAGKQYGMPNIPHVISLLGRVATSEGPGNCRGTHDKNILGTSPLRVRIKTGRRRRRLSSHVRVE